MGPVAADTYVGGVRSQVLSIHWYCKDVLLHLQISKKIVVLLQV
jgi:hypothetical protein